jgi:hypothetical protein
MFRCSRIPKIVASVCVAMVDVRARASAGYGACRMLDQVPPAGASRRNNFTHRLHLTPWSRLKALSSIFFREEMLLQTSGELLRC